MCGLSLAFSRVTARPAGFNSKGIVHVRRRQGVVTEGERKREREAFDTELFPLFRDHGLI